jgi:hypothetical protein
MTPVATLPDGSQDGGKDSGWREDRSDKSSTYSDGELANPDDFRRELEKLQVATIYSLVEEVPMDNGSKINFLFLTVILMFRG